MRGRGEPTLSPRRVKAAKRQLAAVEMRIEGKTFQQIATKLRFSEPSAARAAVKAGLDKTLQEPTNELRRLERERLDRLHALLWARVQADNSDYAAIDRLIKVADRLSKLLGLDQPIKIAQTDSQGNDIYKHLTDNDLKRAILKVCEGVEDDEGKELLAQAKETANAEVR